MVCRSFIRKAMVNTMFRAVQERDPGFHGCSAGFGGEGEEEEEGEEGGWGEDAVVPRAIESAAGACVLWCTVAMGCLIRGRPKSSVSSFCRLFHDIWRGDGGGGDGGGGFMERMLLGNIIGWLLHSLVKMSNRYHGIFHRNIYRFSRPQ